MEPFENKFQQPGKDDRFRNFHQIEDDIPKSNFPQQVNKSEPTPMPELKKGSKGEMVMKAQRILKTTSDYIGYIDGDFGSFMEAAVQSFQRRSKIPINGIIDNDTWNALNQIDN